jgi:hypothetical protein
VLPAHQNESAPGTGASGQIPPTAAGPAGHGRVENVATAVTTSTVVDVLRPSPPPSPPRIPHEFRQVRNQGRTHSIRSISLLFLSPVLTVPFSRSVTLAHRKILLSLGESFTSCTQMLDISINLQRVLLFRLVCV